ncbi:hypothetical protein GCM10009751_40140 [Myceligenerans crystallogenes]|uniref:Streptomycin 6-kinase n=1 Tax=Myceligenerans crystallogenes TaxID=316335 RepID=A0ABN2NMV6_9MICO
MLAAATWGDLGTPRTPAGLRALRRALHPDVCAHPRAAEAFAHVTGLYEGPDFRLRVATGRRHGPGALLWRPEPGFEDLADVADRAHRALAGVRHPGFFSRRGAVPAAAPPAAGVVVYDDGDASARWWFLADFPRLDARTTVWVAKRLAAATAQAAEAGWVHGDVHAGTVVLNPAEHGLRLDGWWSGVRLGERLEVAPTAPTPPRWLGGARADARLTVAQSAALLLAAGAPAPDLADVLRRHAADPGDPADLLRDVDQVARRLYGRPAWHLLREPDRPPI